MKFVIAKLVILVTVFPGFPQNDTERSPSNVEILSQKWSKIAVLQGPDRRDRRVFDPRSGNPSTRESRMSRGTRYVYEAKVKNNGSGVIKAISWDFVFNDPKTGKEIDRRNFFNEVTIHPAKTTKLEGYTRSAPTSTISATGEQAERVVIECVVLDNGSVWRDPSYKGTCGNDRK